MRVRISKTIGLSVILVAFVVGARARADFHATANVRLNGFNQTVTGETSATVQGSYHDPFVSESGSATAQGNPGVSGVLVTGASSGVGNGVFTDATWTDTVVLSGPAGSVLPDYVDLFFHTEGVISLSLNGLGDYIGFGRIGVGGISFLSLYTLDSVMDQVDTVGGAWDKLQFGGGVLSGTWHDRIFLGLPDAFGNRAGDWRVEYYTELDERFGRGSINGNDPPTFSFDAVRLTDGRTPEEAGLSLTFGSGIASPNLRSVPEPSSVALTLLGAATLGGWGWRKHRARPLAEV